MKGNSKVKFFSVIIIIAILTCMTFFDVSAILGNLLNTKFPKINNVYDIRTGIDIRGGIDVKLYAKNEDGSTPDAKDLESAKSVIERRLDNKQVLDREITIDEQKACILVRIPYQKGDTSLNAQQTIKDIGQTAKLTFREVDETKKDPNTGDYLPTDKIVIQGNDVVDTGVVTGNTSKDINVSLKLSDEATKKFAEATGRLIGKPIAIFMDDQLITAPNVSVKITDGNAVITGQRDAKEAAELAALIKSGALPFSLKAEQINSISPYLGDNALQVAVYAGIVAFLLVCVFMLAYYRLPGLLAIIALIAHTVIQLLCISWTGLTITLPGIAGIILTIGMGVDANVIIFERIKEELRNGKTLKAAIDVGFSRAFKAVFDANMTTLISSFALIWFGTGSMKSFGYTLGLGVILSFLTAVTASRIMLKSVAGHNIAKNHKLYGV